MFKILILILVTGLSILIYNLFWWSLSPSTSSFQNICAGTDAKNFDCYESYYTKLVKEKGIANAVADIKKIMPQTAMCQVNAIL